MLNILITGGSGFLGSKLAYEFLSLGHCVSLLLRPTSRLERIANHASEFNIGRASSDQDVHDFVVSVSPDIVIHTACAYGRHGESLLEISDVNYRLGLLIVQSILKSEKPVKFLNTGTVLTSNVSLYALTKNLFPQTVRLLGSAQPLKLQFINILLQHIYGPGDDVSKFTAHVIQACRSKQTELDLTAGTQIRDFIYIDDVASAFRLIVEKIETLSSSIDIEVGTGVAVSVKEFVQAVHRLTASSTRLKFGALPMRLNEPIRCVANISIMSSLGWKPEFDVESGVKRTLMLTAE